MLKKLAAVYALVSTACTSWQIEKAPAPKAIEQSGKKGEATVRVELKSGARYEIFAATLVGDSIIGRNTPTVFPETTQRIAVATADVRSIRRNKLNVGRTVFAVVAIAAAAAVIVGSTASSSSTSSSNSGCASTTA